MASHWYNPLSWRMFGYEDPKDGEYVEVEMTVGGKATKAGVRITPTKAMTISIVYPDCRSSCTTTRTASAR
jgi:hypothetical protein